jgi:hypothetical protein
MSDPKEPYPIAPDGAETSPNPAPPPDKAKAADLKAKLNLSGLLEDFEEDADFDKDPELQARILGKTPGTITAPVAAAPPLQDFVGPGAGQPRHWAIIGCVLLVGALIAAGVTATDHHVARILLTLYGAFVNTGAGLVALYVSARLLERRFGAIESAAARMFAVVCVFTLLRNLNLKFFGPNLPALNTAATILIAMAGYVLALAAIFKLWDKQKLGFVAGFHVLFWVTIEIGMTLAAVVDSAPAKTS